MPKNEALLLTKAETAALLRVTQRTLDRYRAAGLVAPVYLGRTVRYRREDIDALITKGGAA